MSAKFTMKQRDSNGAARTEVFNYVDPAKVTESNYEWLENQMRIINGLTTNTFVELMYTNEISITEAIEE